MVKARRGTFHQVQICVSIAQSTCSLPCELQQGHYMMAVSQEMHAPLAKLVVSARQKMGDDALSMQLR